MRLRQGVPLIAATGVALASAGAVASLAPAAGPFLCKGKFQKPGVLKGTYSSGVIVKGVCAVKHGKAHVIGTLTVTKGAAFVAAFGRHHSSLKVTGNLVVGKGATVILGCKVNPDGSGSACIDDPNMKHPTLTSHEVVTGNIIESSPLGVVVHNSSIGGNIKQSGGGGGLSCAPPKTGIFASMMSPVFSDYEDNSVGGSTVISKLNSCWLGVGREKIGGSLTVNKNEMADPDAIEVFSNHISKNLACSGNSHPSPMPPGDQPVWDSGEIPMNGAIYPRRPQPNTVGGKRRGQCVTATPTTQGGASGPGAF
jgi:hypothetical protein